VITPICTPLISELGLSGTLESNELLQMMILKMLKGRLPQCCAAANKPAP
jgi:hypothetical protein